jgi:hypothetical protein
MARHGAVFIGERVEVILAGRGALAKRPACPSSFIWRGEKHVVLRCLMEWKDYARRGKMVHNMREGRAAAAEGRGSRGVGRYYFRVITEAARVFDLYYDRAPKNVLDKKGSWHLLQEITGAPHRESEG